MAATPLSWTPTDCDPTRGGLSTLADTLLAIRSTADVGTLCGIAGAFAVRHLAAREYRLLRLDPRSGALRCLDEFGIETPYLPESGGPVERALRDHGALLHEASDPAAARESALWSEAPGAVATVPLSSGGTIHGLLLVAFEGARRLDAEEQAFAQVVAGTLALALERAELQRSAAVSRRRATELEQRLMDDEESSSQLMSVVAHEIRSPLTAIKAYAEALLDNPPNSHAQRDRFLGIINSECDRLSRLVADILDVARLESGKRPLRLARFAFEPVVREALETLAPLARARHVQLEPRVETELVVECDPDLLRRLVLNMIGNALQYSPRGEGVRIEAVVDGDSWRMTVEDRGPGVPPEDLPRIFERFFRARAAVEEGVEGHGLGLAICKGIVEVHGGRIWAESGVPSGTRICFAMPVRQLATPRARRIARLVATRADVRQLFDETVELVAATAGAEVVSLSLVDAEQGDLVIAAARGLNGLELKGRRTPVRSGVSGAVAAWGKPLLIENIETDRRFERLSHPQYSSKSLLCVPLRVAGEVLGVFNVTNKSAGGAFTEDDLSVLEVLIDRVGRALERVWAHAGNQRVMEEALEAIRSMTQLKREGLLGGRESVHLVRSLARELGMAAADVELLGYVASIHDVGMVRLRTEVENERGLDSAGRRAVERHPEVSLEILRPFGYLARVSEVILAHHERWDGHGYPRGLAGEAIPLGARILAVVDAWDSMVQGRPHRVPVARETAREEIAGQAGLQFDPNVVETFLALPAIRRAAA